MKTTMLTSIIFIALLPHIVTAIVVQELYPDPINTDTGGEAILLFNEQDSAIDISGWTVSTPSAATDATVPLNTTLSGHGL